MHFSRFINTPLAVLPSRAGMLLDIGEMFIDIADRPYRVVAGIALIPVVGTLVAKLGRLSPLLDLATGYDGIKASVLMAMADPSVKALLFQFNSGGGEVSGCFDLADQIYGLRGKKPMWAACDEHAYSAAYALASACDLVTVPRTGGCGSVGVICLHVDMSGALDKAGMKVSMITFGARKAETSEVEPLSADARAHLQADVDAMGRLFCQTVARNRGLGLNNVIETEAGTFLGQAGVSAGLADAVASFDETFAALSSFAK